jgi:hypothetical protein
MATTKSSKARTGKAKKQDEQIGTTDGRSVTWQDVAEHGGDVIPVLVGPTGAGKTARVYQWAEATGRDVAVVLLATMPPEEVLGLPTGGDGPVAYRPPEWLVNAHLRPTVVFFDELDKAHKDTLATVLTLISSRAARGLALHPESRIVAAMQPVDPRVWLQHETQRALAARSCFIAVGYEWSYLADKYRLDLSDLATPEVTVPVLQPVSPRQIEWSIKFIQSNLDASDISLGKVLAGIVGDFAPELVRRVRDAVAITPRAIVEAIDRDLSLIETLTIPEMIALVPESLRYGKAKPHAELVKHIWINGTRDDRAAALRVETATLQELHDQGVEVLWPDESEEATDQAETTAHLAIAEAWQKAKLQRKKK